MRSTLVNTAILVLAYPTLATAQTDAQLAQFQGAWEVNELVEDGKVIPKEAIRQWLPSGGKVHITDNAIVFKSPQDGQKHAKVFSIDTTCFPKGIQVTSRDQQVSHGIYRFDGDQLVVCFSDPSIAAKPFEFSAAEGSKRMLMVLNRADKPPASSAITDVANVAKSQSSTVPATPRPGSTTASPSAVSVLTDAQVKQMLAGTWQMNDGLGLIYANINPDGTFHTTRDVQEIRVFQTVFVRTPVSSGNWNVANGQLTYHVSASTHPERAGRTIAMAVRSISSKDVIFVDALGRVGTGIKVR